MKIRPGQSEIFIAISKGWLSDFPVFRGNCVSTIGKIAAICCRQPNMPKEMAQVNKNNHRSKIVEDCMPLKIVQWAF